MSDIALVLKNNCFDLNLKNGDLERDEGLETAVAISLFSDRRVTDEEKPDLANSKKGFWGDMFSEIDQDKIGSRLWVLDRAKRTDETLRRAEDFAREALNWLIEDGVADNIEVIASFDETASNSWLLNVTIKKPAGNSSKFLVVWNEQAIKRG